MIGPEADAADPTGLGVEDQHQPDEEAQPRGTLVFLLGFIVMIALMWSLTFFLLIERS